MHKLYQTIKEEYTEPVEGTVSDSLPGWLCGGLYRNGPGMYEIGEQKFNHVFDTMALFQKFQIENQRVTYQTRYLHGDTFKTNMAAQRIVVQGVGTKPPKDPNKNALQRFGKKFKTAHKTDNTIVGFFPLGDELYSTTESNLVHRVDPDTLETLEKVDISDHVAIFSASPHPHVDPDGTLHNIGHSYKGGPKIGLFKVPPKEDSSAPFPKGEVVSALKMPGKMSLNYLHSFAMTDNFYIYLEQPLCINLVKILTAKMRGATMMSAIEFKPDLNVRFRIVNKQTGEEVNPKFKYEAAPMIVFYHINAYEENDNVIVDLCAFKTDASMHHNYLKNLQSENCEADWRKIEEPEPRRYVIPVNVSQSTPMEENLVDASFGAATAVRRNEHTIFCFWETLADTGFEFPHINYKHYNGKKYKYSYGIGWHNAGKHFNTVCKIDAETRTFIEWGEDNCYPSEPTFVANPNPASEDDGVVLSAVNSSEFDSGKMAFLLVLDAKTMKELARVEFKNVPRFARDFHGLFRDKTINKS